MSDIRFPLRRKKLGGGKEMVTNEFRIGRHGKCLRCLPYKHQSVRIERKMFGTGPAFLSQLAAGGNPREFAHAGRFTVLNATRL